MTTLNIGGKRVKVGDEFLSMSPEQQAATVEEIAQSLSIAPQQEMSWGETAIDAVKSAGTGIVEGAVGLAGLPRDAGQWLGEQATWGIGRMMGQSNEEIAAQQAQAAQAMEAGGMAAPSSQQIMGAVEGVTGPLPMPQSTLGEYARTTGQMAAGALAGPGGLIRKGAMTLIPGVASEAAGQATEGDWIEPYARIAGGVAGGVAAAGRGNAGTRQMLKDVTDIDKKQAAVKAARDADYRMLKKGGIKYDANGYQQFADDVVRRFTDDGFDAALNPQAAALASRIAGLAGKSPDFNDLDIISKVAGNILRGGQSVSKADKAFAARTLAELDQWAGSAALISNGTIDPSQVQAIAKRARELARRTIMAEQIDEMGRVADWYTSGGESGLRNQFANHGRSAKGKYLTDAEEAAYKKVVRREGPLGVSTAAGSNLNTIGAMVAGGAGVPFTGGASLAVAAGGVAANRVARKLMERYTLKAVKDAKKTVLAGKKAQSAAVARDQEANIQRIVRALLATDSARRSAQQPFLTDAQGNSYAYPGSGQ